ncbi:hypothetical protein UlMin_014304 [Ulmus minor]
MVLFSCFNAHIHSHKPKKTMEPMVEAMHKKLKDCSHGHVSEDLPNKRSSLNSREEGQVNNVMKHVSSGESDSKSEEFILEGDSMITKKPLKKSQSLGSGLYQKGKVSVDNDAEDDTDQGFSYDGSHDHDSKDQGLSPPYQNQKENVSNQVTCGNVNTESIFSVGDQPHSEKEGAENSDTPLSGEFVGESSNHTPPTPRVIVKSSSSPNIGAFTHISEHHMHVAPRSRSAEDLHVLDMRWKEISIHKVEKQFKQGQLEDDNIVKAEKSTFEDYVDDNYDSLNYSGLAKDWIMPVVDKIDTGKTITGESSIHKWDQLPNKNFKVKRIEEWVNDLQHCCPLEETNESSDFHSYNQMKKDSSISNGLAAAKVGNKVIPSTEAAQRYISSLSAVSSTAHLVNHGLVVIPPLCAFVSLRMLNLSGNSIVRITAGVLPRGLHTLNLSKNSISTIEGLRDLTRLRILDLSYNRILRIGHGLASCSSLKELYLAGNKISDVEGLHRLLKLAVLDLRFNKISTAKCLGQLAANYNSLQAISLEGNPAQKNVGDDQLKKFLLGLLPNLAYFNRKPIKSSTLKDAADRSLRLAVGSHQFDRGLRSDHKATKKGLHTLAAQKPSTSSVHGRGGSQAVASPKRSKGSRHGRLPPTGIKTTTHNRHQYFDSGNKIQDLRLDLSIRRSRSEGTLGAL